MILSKKYWRLFIFGFGIFAFLLLVFLSFNVPIFCYEWCIGDWLINYQGGIVRRGLAGELFFEISHAFGVNEILLIIIFQIIIYGIYIFNACKLAIKSYFLIPNIVLFLSPAFVLFPILNPMGGFRKEILLFALLSTICIYFQEHDYISRFSVLVISVVSIFIALNHEMLIIYLLYTISALAIYEGGFGIKTKRIVLATAPALLLGLLLAIFAKGSQEITKSICMSIKEYAPLDCVSPSILGSISFLSKDVSFAHQFTLESMKSDSAFIYVILVILSSTPLLLIFRTEFNTLKSRKSILYLCAPIILSIPLFWVVADFGRLIYIHVSCLSLIILMANPDKDDRPLKIYKNDMFLVCFCFIFIVIWRLTHFNVSMESNFPLVQYFIHF